MITTQTILLNGSYAPSLLQFRGELIRTLVNRGHDVHVAAPAIELDLARELVALGAHVHEVPLSRLGLNPLCDLQYAFALYKLINKIRANCIVSYTAKPNIWGSIAARFAKIPSVSMVTGLGYAFGVHGNRKQRIIGGIVHRLYAFATASNEKVIFQNPDDVRDFTAAGCLKDSSKVVIVNGSGIDTASFRPSPLPDGPIFLMIARYLKSKGIREYINAANELASRRTDCRFLLVGFPDDGVDGVPKQELERLLTGSVECLGHLSDVRPAIDLASVYVLPSYREGTPRTVLEAMAMGRAIVTTDAPGCRETVKEGVNGLLVEVGNVPMLVGAMEHLANSHELRQSMGMESRGLAKLKYDVHSVNTEIVRQLRL